MTHAEHADAAEKPTSISIVQRSGIWRVALNGAFYGDYTRRYWAIEAAFEKADDIAARGGAAIITTVMDGQQDALLYDTRRRAKSQRERAWSAPAARAPRASRRPSVVDAFASWRRGSRAT